MDQNSPRIPPAIPEQFTHEQKELVGAWSSMNFTRVIVNHPELFRAFVPLIKKLIPNSNLPPRHRQILVLRTLTLCDEVYELAHQILISRNAGMNDSEIEMAMQGNIYQANTDQANTDQANTCQANTGLSLFEQTLMKAAEELVRNQNVSDETWRDLAQHYSQIELMEVVALVGGYTMMAMVTKSYGMQLEDPETFNNFSRMRKYT